MKIIVSYFIEAAEKFKLSFCKSFLMTVLVSLANLATIIYFRLILNHISTSSTEIIKYLIILCLLLVFTSFINVLWSISLDKFGGEYIAYLVHQCQTSIYNTKFENVDSSKISHALYNDILNIFRVVGNFIPSLLCSVILIILLLILSITIDLFISLFLLFSIIVGIMISYISRKIIVESSTSTNQKLKEYYNTLHEYTDKVEYIKTNNLLSYFVNLTQAKITNFISSSVKEDKKIYFFSTFTQNYNSLMQFILSIFLSLPVYQNSLPNLAFYIILFNFLMSQGQRMELLFQQINRNKVCFTNISEIRNLPVHKGDKLITDITAIELKDISFSYPNKSKNILDHFSLQLMKGDFALVKGTNGVGKTTLFRILLNQYSPTSGEVLINNEKLDSYSMSSYYDSIAYISQHEPVLNTSIKKYLEEISHSTVKPDTVDQIISRLQMFNLHHINESELSGGEKKKVLLSKLMSLEDKVSLILIDEVDAELDAETKDKFYSHLNDLASNQDKIILVIQHNDTSLLNYNKTISF
mgnify:FL=1